MPPAIIWRDGGREFGVFRRDVLAVMRQPELSLVPAAPRWLRGVANRFGRAVPVIDLGVLAGSTVLPAPVGHAVVVPVEGGEIAVAAARTPEERTLGLPNRVEGCFEVHGATEVRVVDLARLVAQLDRSFG